MRLLDSLGLTLCLDVALLELEAVNAHLCLNQLLLQSIVLLEKVPVFPLQLGQTAIDLLQMPYLSLQL